MKRRIDRRPELFMVAFDAGLALVLVALVWGWR